jgi:hypothetical protein
MMDMTPNKPEEKPGTNFRQSTPSRPPTLLQEFAQFIIENKAWWMIPILLALGLIGLLILLAPTGATPFIYTLF